MSKHTPGPWVMHEVPSSWFDDFGANSPVFIGNEQDLHDILRNAVAKAKGEK